MATGFHGCRRGADARALVQAMYLGQGGNEGLYGGSFPVDCPGVLSEICDEQGLLGGHSHILVHGRGRMGI